ncbi:CHAP domain-containing protein [Streptococcus thermophilus]|uniref:COG3942 and LysM peptidoglycan-binding domain-containing protein n=1 Tax=Streptococcus thermophilus TaxID=1308 RepID=UPI0002D476A2|nr:CHAP domain-containing protein [Streptococcus thermophilus]ALX90832.1 peptigoglycan-binding protein LysM [Streptococcus thermophilus]ANS61000.1 peptigoglycan-binding protein LysM [Streptococcus thermophilus]MBW7795778.1 CHAP domain-containing protein [Streptococcus thermophilus]MCT2905114.1 CHAP domain-containing protein [Streptococcus thermophilus]MCT2933174.1 CHAP domain-containing protein [Streptococcus thermophilus]
MLSKSKTTKALLYSTAALSLFAASHVHADETSHWTARSVDQIKADISVNDNQQTYTVQYGDTLGSIVEAMGIDMNVLANIKEITNIDLIFPGTVLTTTYNADNQAVSVKVETPSSETSDTPVVAESNLTTNEVTVNGQSVVASDLSAPVETVSLTATQAPAKEESTQVVSEVTEAIASASDTPAYADTEQPVADAIDHVTSSAEETLAEEEAPATETSAQAETTEVAAYQEAATSEAASETPVASEAPASVVPVATSEAVSEAPAASEAPESSEAPAEQLAAASEAPESSEAPAEQLAAASEVPAEQPAATSEAASEAPASVVPVATSEAVSEAPAASEVPAEQLAAASEAPESSEVPAEQPAATSEAAPAASTPNTYPVGQCTWGAKSLAPWAGNNWGNAKDWIASAQAAGHSVGTTPVAGAIAVWPKDGGGYGHVAYVTSASGVNSIQVMESNYAGNMLIGNYRGTFDPTSSAHGGSVFYIYP